MSKFVNTYGKALAYVVATILTAVASFLSGGITAAEGVQIAIAGTGALLVWVVPLHPSWPWAKTVIGVVLAVLNALATLVLGGLNGSEIIGLALVALAALGVTVAPSTSTVKPALE
jgi:hypothetical protein